MESRFTLGINITSAAAAVVAAGVAVWQAVEASDASDAALRSALTSQRLSTCIRMNQNLETASTMSSWHDVMDKPYARNPRFMTLAAAMKFSWEDARLFRQMTPGKDAEKFLDDVGQLHIKIGDMVLDGSDYLTNEQLQNGLSNLQQAQRAICDKMIAPPGGF